MMDERRRQFLCWRQHSWHEVAHHPLPGDGGAECGAPPEQSVPPGDHWQTQCFPYSAILHHPASWDVTESTGSPQRSPGVTTGKFIFSLNQEMFDMASFTGAPWSIHSVQTNTQLFSWICAAVAQQNLLFYRKFSPSSTPPTTPQQISCLRQNTEKL